MKSEKPIKDWSEDERPREKLVQKGKEYLSTAELLAILIGSGSREESALSLAQRILQDSGGLGELGSKSLDFFRQFKGMGLAKSVSLVAAMELGRRKLMTPVSSRAVISSSSDAYNLLGPFLADLGHEEFWIACLNRRNQILSKERISAGGISATVVDPKIIFNRSLLRSASSIILFHNHPSGNLSPSKEDIQLTRKVVEAGKLLEVKVLDHLIVGNGYYLSFADEGMI